MENVFVQYFPLECLKVTKTLGVKYPQNVVAKCIEGLKIFLNDGRQFEKEAIYNEKHLQQDLFLRMTVEHTDS